MGGIFSNFYFDLVEIKKSKNQKIKKIKKSKNFF